MGALATPTAAQAQSVGEDSVTGTGTCCGGTGVFVFDAHSGRSGENPGGTVTATTNGEPFFSGQVTCLSVTANVALGKLDSGTFAGLIAFRVVDNAGRGSPDTVNVFLDFGGAPTTCSTVTFFEDPLPITDGDLVVVDAPPFPTSKHQCKDGGWRNYGDTFRNQGQCVAYVERGPKP